MNRTLEEIGLKLKHLREQSGMTQSNIAAFLKVDQSLISKFEKGERSITSDSVDKLASLYGIPLSFLEENTKDVKPLTIALRSNELNEADLETICNINRIALNCNFITSLLKECQIHE